MRHIIAITSLAFLLTACGRKSVSTIDSNSETTSKLLGAWSVYKYKWGDGAEETNKSEFKILFGADGFFETSVSKVLHDRTNHLLLTGTWKLTSNEIFLVMTNASGELKHEPLGSVDNVKIERIDKNELVYSLTNQTVFLKREGP